MESSSEIPANNKVCAMFDPKTKFPIARKTVVNPTFNAYGDSFDAGGVLDEKEANLKV